MRTPIRAARAALAPLLALAAACSDASTAPEGTVTRRFELATDAAAWTVGFADHPLTKESDWELVGGPRPLPTTLGGGAALFLSGRNHSDDLFPFATRMVDGLTPNTAYRARLAVELATRAPAGCVGVGGAPGESQYVKAGVAGREIRAVAEDGMFRLNVDKGNQSNGGPSALVLGNLGTTASRCDAFVWARKSLDSGAAALDVTSDAAGRVWLLVGVDSGFEGTVEYYVTAVRVELAPRR